MKGSISSGVLLVTALLLAGCQTISPDKAGLAPEDARIVARKAIPPNVKDAGGWATDIQTSLLRSEERRVGKECRSRWSPYH